MVPAAPAARVTEEPVIELAVPAPPPLVPPAELEPPPPPP